MSQNEFARSQLTKHGWTDGQGLGKGEQGRTEAIKVHVKNNKTGIGHDPGAEFTQHWWDDVFNKTASSIQVETTEDGSIKVARRKEKKLKKKAKKKALYGNFVKGATLTQEDGHHVETGEHSDSSSEEKDTQAKKLTEEELFDQCGGRTAHKGARHGLGLSGKLQRVQDMEQKLLEQMTAARRETELLKRPIEEKEQSPCFDNEGLPPHKKKKKKKKKKKQPSDEEIRSCGRVV